LGGPKRPPPPPPPPPGGGPPTPPPPPHSAAMWARRLASVMKRMVDACVGPQARVRDEAHGGCVCGPAGTRP
jgi:hypothetical protein